MTTATTSPEGAPPAPAPLSLRVAVIGLVTPVILMLAGMAFWPEQSGGPGTVLVSNERLAGTALYELVLIATLGTWLWRKGWRPHRTATLPFTERDMARGVGVWRLAAPNLTAIAYAVEPLADRRSWSRW